MRKTIFLAVLVLVTLPALSQGKKYNKAMKAAVENMHKATDPQVELELVSNFTEISEKYPDQWLPFYHASRILITSSFAQADAEESDAMLDQAKKRLDQAMELAPEESEIHVLESLYYVAMMSVDPDTRGQVYYQDALDAIEKGLKLNPENPRAHFMNGMMTLNLPEFMGGGTQAATPIFQQAAEKFKAFQNDDPFWPSWGEDLNQSELDRFTN